MVEVSLARLNAMRAYFALILVERAWRVLPAFVDPERPLGPFDGTAYAFWGALALLAALGLRYPLRMVPLLLIHLVYKSLWLLGVALPRWAVGEPFDPLMTSFAWAMAIGVVLDLLVMPWSYVVAYYVRSPGDAWRGKPGGMTAAF